MFFSEKPCGSHLSNLALSQQTKMQAMKQRHLFHQLTSHLPCRA